MFDLSGAPQLLQPLLNSYLKNSRLDTVIVSPSISFYLFDLRKTGS
jgi:hypothetical protein